jgi:preprotein translocase subunit SecA
MGNGLRAFARFAKRVEQIGRGLRNASSRSIAAQAAAARTSLLSRGFTPEAAAEIFALVREVSQRELGLRHYPVQLMGGCALLQGCLAEMETGEGKTLTAALPAIAAALAGHAVHVITVNDYLARRDAELLRPLFRAFGLSVGFTEHGQSPEERRQVYASDIVYCTNKDLVFDYLRDRLAVRGSGSPARRRMVQAIEGTGASHPPLLLRGLQFAIVDEADSVLIDEARTPLIISSGGSDDAREAAWRSALDAASRLMPARDYTIEAGGRSVALTEAGKVRLERSVAALGDVMAIRRAREELCEQALRAMHCFHRDKHYIIADGKVQIVDEFTGRVLPDRSWERGLHQLIEIKEGCDLTGEHRTLARITYQRFFRRYLSLSGITGTAKEVAPELHAVYGLRVVRIPTHRPVQRRSLGGRPYQTAEHRWQAVVDATVQMVRDAGRPVLIGTRSVAASEEVARRLVAVGIEPRILNARHHEQEAAIIAEAGTARRVTVATNMAGRGTDIRLSRETRDQGGLHVILTEFHESKRIDRQLYGRCGRQGDPGTHEAIASLEDDLFRTHVRRAASWARAGAAVAPISGPIAIALVRAGQRRAERESSRARRETLRRDRQDDTTLAFSGTSE